MVLVYPAGGQVFAKIFESACSMKLTPQRMTSSCEDFIIPYYSSTRVRSEGQQVWLEIRAAVVAEGGAGPQSNATRRSRRAARAHPGAVMRACSARAGVAHGRRGLARGCMVTSRLSCRAVAEFGHGPRVRHCHSREAKFFAKIFARMTSSCEDFTIP